MTFGRGPESNRLRDCYLLSYKEQLRLVREYTGDAFTAKHGYSMSRSPNFGQRMAVFKYYLKIHELSAVDTVTYTPRTPQERSEAFHYTGQAGFKKFRKAIIRKLSPDQDLEFRLDKSRPRGSRFVVRDKNTGRDFIHLPAYLFRDILDEDLDADDMMAQIEEIIEDHAADAHFFLINAGESYMWGSGGGREKIAGKIHELFHTYSANNFDANDKNSSYFGNWFRGVTAFTSRYDVIDKIGAALTAKREYRAKWKMHPNRNYRELKNGMLGVFEDGRLIETIAMTWKRK